MAVASGISVAAIYLNQPMMGLIGQEFPASPLARLVPTVTQLGYAAGVFLLVPLGDLIDRRKLIIIQFLLLAVALAAVAMAPSAATLLATSLLVGIGATVAQHIVPFAAHLASPHNRGQVVGTVMAGLLGGILLSQTVAGFIGAHGGWRMMFWVAVPLTLAGAAAMMVMLPRDHADGRHRYGAALKSLWHLWQDEPSLRQATLVQAALFAAFSAFWATLAVHLQDFHLGADAAGLFGIVGILGVAAAPWAGRLADRHGPTFIVRNGAALAAAAWLLLTLWDSIVALAGAVAVMNIGIQSALIANQHIIYALRPEARSRLNTLFMTGMFLGGSAGSAGATALYGLGGWPAVSALGLSLGVLALLLRSSRRHVAA
jgi:Arabinose efflux permease